MLKTGLLLSVRNKSTRFPGKVLKEINGKSVTHHLIDRLKQVRNADEIILSTSPDPRDTVLCDIAEECGIAYYRGHPDDKLERYLDTCKEFDLEACVIVDGDDNLVFPEYLEETVEQIKTGDYDFVGIENLPLGARGTGLTRQALQTIMDKKDVIDTEVWGHLFVNDSSFNCLLPVIDDPLFAHPEIRLTLDYQQDFDLFQRIFNELGPTFTSRDIMELLVNQKPELNKINESAQALYEANLPKNC